MSEKVQAMVREKRERERRENGHQITARHCRSSEHGGCMFCTDAVVRVVSRNDPAAFNHTVIRVLATNNIGSTHEIRACLLCAEELRAVLR